MKNILLPTDFSENAWNAACYAVTLYEKEECTFYLLNTYTPAIVHSRFMASSKPKDDLGKAVGTSSKEGLEKFLDRIEDKFQNTKHGFKTISSFSLLVEKIKDVVEEKAIDLIVTGTKGASGLTEVFMGSNTVRIIKSVKNCPVLAVPEQSKFLKPTEIAFATDFNRFYAQSELEPLIDIANTFGAVVRIVYVQHDNKQLTELQQFNLNMLHKYLQNIKHYVHTISELNSISRTLEVFGDEFNIHLFAMLNYQHSFIESITRKSVVKQTAFHTSMPLLVISELTLDNNRSSKKKTDKTQFNYN